MYVNIIWLCFLFTSLCFAIAQPDTISTMVELTQEWRPEVGWVVNCTWLLAPNDRLQAVFLYRDNRQFANYRPAKKFNGPYLRHMYSTIDDDMQLVCEENTSKCTMLIEPVQPLKADISITCEVSGEGPMFRVGNKSLTVETVVLPSDAVLEASRASEDSNLLNCSSTGVPAPKIEWTMGDGQMNVKGFHSDRIWNVTSKLWYSWSTLMVTSDQLPVVCTPKASRGASLHVGKSAQYNSASRIGFRDSYITHTVILISISLLLR